MHITYAYMQTIPQPPAHTHTQAQAHTRHTFTKPTHCQTHTRHTFTKPTDTYTHTLTSTYKEHLHTHRHTHTHTCSLTHTRTHTHTHAHTDTHTHLLRGQRVSSQNQVFVGQVSLHKQGICPGKVALNVLPQNIHHNTIQYKTNSATVQRSKKLKKV